MLQRKTLLHPMNAPASNYSTLYALLPVAPTSYILVFDPANSMLLFLTPLLPMLLLCIPYVPASNASILYALSPMLLLSLIPLPILLIQCSCSLCFCSLCALLCIPLHPMFQLPKLQLFMPCPRCSYLVHPCFCSCFQCFNSMPCSLCSYLEHLWV
jgi:hypothetical protein